MNQETDVVSKPTRGRPRIFDQDAVLEAAMALFWDRGFEGTSFDALTAAMNISASSFYNAFGSKEELYSQAINHYMTRTSVWFGSILNGPGETKAVIEHLLEASAVKFTQKGLPAGCMISLAGTHLHPTLNSLRHALRASRNAAEGAVRARLEAGIADGDLAADTDVVGLAAFFEAVFRGMAVGARDGKSTEQLLSVGRHAMRAWPGD
jgi:AcrR family transcriptional regulator